MEEINPISLAQVKHQFYVRGEGISGWAQANGFSAAMVYSVLNGRCKARRGQAHRIAVALGLKQVPTTAVFAEVLDPASGAKEVCDC